MIFTQWSNKLHTIKWKTKYFYHYKRWLLREKNRKNIMRKICVRRMFISSSRQSWNLQRILSIEEILNSSIYASMICLVRAYLVPQIFHFRRRAGYAIIYSICGSICRLRRCSKTGNLITAVTKSDRNGMTSEISRWVDNVKVENRRDGWLSLRRLCVLRRFYRR